MMDESEEVDDQLNDRWKKKKMPIELQWKIARYVTLFGIIIIVSVFSVAVYNTNQEKSIYGFTSSSSSKGNSETVIPRTDLSKSTTANDDDKLFDAYFMSQKFVKQNLKAPSSAKFPGYKKEFSEYKDGNYVVVAYVESQNSFGAMLKQTYICEMNYKGNNNWSLIEVNFY
jgi:hypothetical protein